MGFRGSPVQIRPSRLCKVKALHRSAMQGLFACTHAEFSGPLKYFACGALGACGEPKSRVVCPCSLKHTCAPTPTPALACAGLHLHTDKHADFRHRANINCVSGWSQTHSRTARLQQCTSMPHSRREGRCYRPPAMRPSGKTAANHGRGRAHLTLSGRCNGFGRTSA
jgi:hypothetical protein